tara:strand:+ start:325 stop:525 length:201 start_codon:yes stop_codon:yes gene_type:complete
MSAQKRYYEEQAEIEIDDIITTLGDGHISIDTAAKKILKVQNVEMTGLNEYNVHDYLFEVEGQGHA